MQNSSILLKANNLWLPTTQLNTQPSLKVFKQCTYRKFCFIFYYEHYYFCVEKLTYITLFYFNLIFGKQHNKLKINSRLQTTLLQAGKYRHYNLHPPLVSPLTGLDSKNAFCIQLPIKNKAC